jgi:hypothetical protein
MLARKIGMQVHFPAPISQDGSSSSIDVGRSNRQAVNPADSAAADDAL